MTEGHNPARKSEERKQVYKEYPEELGILMESYIENPDSVSRDMLAGGLRDLLRTNKFFETKHVLSALLDVNEMRLEDEIAKLRRELLGEIRATEPRDEERFQAS